ncbi:MAG: glycosyltransferase family 2 protein [Bacilli bacterium]|nr:glycosyltransferase family 2 protein [Bacilli bacterium]
MSKKKLSIVVSCFNEEEALPMFYKAISNVAEKMDNLDFEFLFVDDGSSDNTLKLLKKYSSHDDKVRFISFSRNFGKEAAMYAGLKESTGDYITVMDADLQDPPSLLPEMYRLIALEGYDIVATRRVSRSGEPKIRSFFARQFYKLINKMTDRVEIVDGARDFRLMTRQVVDSILSLGEYNRFSKGLFSFVGFKTKYLEYENIKRIAGNTKWSFMGLFKYAIDGIIAFTTMPLSWPIYFGVLFIFISLILFIIMICKSFIVSSLFAIITLLLFIFGLLFVFVGNIGLYLAKDYLENKKRPIYIVKETDKDL